VTSIGNYAFEECSSLTGVLQIPDSTFIGIDAFNGCSRLCNGNAKTIESIDPCFTAPDPQTKKGHWTTGGCKDNPKNISHAAEVWRDYRLAGVRCCNDTEGDFKCYSKDQYNKCYPMLETFNTMKGVCEDDGKRLCTKDEMEAKRCCTGCNKDYNRIWTSSSAWHVCSDYVSRPEFETVVSNYFGRTGNFLVVFGPKNNVHTGAQVACQHGNVLRKPAVQLNQQPGDSVIPTNSNSSPTKSLINSTFVGSAMVATAGVVSTLALMAL